MILQALKEYYDRKAADEVSDIAPPGWEHKGISWVVVLDKDGCPVDIQSTVEVSGKEKTVKKFLVPQSVKRASNITAYLLWDNPEYALGVDLKGKPERVARQHEAFRARVAELGDVRDDGLAALRKFLERSDKLELLEKCDRWEELKKDGSFLVFRLVNAKKIITDSPAVKDAVNRLTLRASSDARRCLITGEEDETERIHAAIKGIRGAIPPEVQSSVSTKMHSVHMERIKVKMLRSANGLHRLLQQR